MHGTVIHTTFTVNERDDITHLPPQGPIKRPPQDHEGARKSKAPRPQKPILSPRLCDVGCGQQIHVFRASHRLSTSNPAVRLTSGRSSVHPTNKAENVAPSDSWACRLSAQNVEPWPSRHPEPAAPAPFETKFSPLISLTLPVTPSNSVSRMELRMDFPCSHSPPVLKGQLRRDTVGNTLLVEHNMFQGHRVQATKPLPKR